MHNLNIEPLEPRCVLSGDVIPPDAVLVYEQIGPGFTQYTYWLQGQIWVTDTRLEDLYPPAGDTPADTLAPPASAIVADIPDSDATLAVFLAELEQGQTPVEVQMLQLDDQWQPPVAVVYEPLPPAGEAAEIADLGGLYGRQWTDEGGEWFSWSLDLEQWSKPVEV